MRYIIRAAALIAVSLLAACGHVRQDLVVKGSTLSPYDVQGEMPPPSDGRYYVNDKVHFYTEFTWQFPQLGAGKHKIKYRLWTGDTMRMEFGDEADFAAPQVFSAYASGVHFGPGHHRFELLVDGKPVASHEFDMAAGDRPDPLPAATEQQIRGQLYSQGKTTVLNRGGEFFDNDAEPLRKSRERSPSGEWKLAELYDGADDLGLDDPESPRWHQLMEAQRDWMAKHPDSPSASIVTAKLMLARAWLYRGHGPANDVPRDKLQLYAQLIDQAANILDSHKEVAARDPEWYRERLAIAKHQSVEPQGLIALAQEGMQRECCYYAMHRSMGRSLVAEWSGSADLLPQYAIAASGGDANDERLLNYWFIYLDLAVKHSPKPAEDLADYAVDWARMKAAYGKLIAAYPDNSNRDTAFGLACIGQQWPWYQELGHWNTPSPSVAWWDRDNFRLQCEASAWGEAAQLTFMQRLQLEWNWELSRLRAFLSI